MWLQVVGFLFIIGWNIGWTAAILLVIKYVFRVPLRMTEEQLEAGDSAVHGEEPYAFYGDGSTILTDGDWPNETLHRKHSSNAGKELMIDSPLKHDDSGSNSPLPTSTVDTLPQQVAVLVQQLDQPHDIGVGRSC
jgi:hypothetical protein